MAPSIPRLWWANCRVDERGCSLQERQRKTQGRLSNLRHVGVQTTILGLRGMIDNHMYVAIVPGPRLSRHAVKIDDRGACLRSLRTAWQAAVIGSSEPALNMNPIKGPASGLLYLYFVCRCYCCLQQYVLRQKHRWSWLGERRALWPFWSMTSLSSSCLSRPSSSSTQLKIVPMAGKRIPWASRAFVGLWPTFTYRPGCVVGCRMCCSSRSGRAWWHDEQFKCVQV